MTGAEALDGVSLVRLGRTSLRDQALSVLRQRLVTGELRPGTIYSVTVLANELGVSNSPVREAMLELQNQGLVEAVRNRGFVVVNLSRQEREDVLEVRMMLEVPAMSRLAGRPELLAAYDRYSEIAQEILDSAREGDVLAFLDADRRFHLGLLGLLGNHQLVDVVGLLRDRTRLFGAAGDILRSAEEHLDLLRALKRGDAGTTTAVMTAHLHHVLGEWSGDQPQD
ncbi:FCD domain-containing protein [Nakamurella sp. YIM 132087]|uniref:FCD domain-containing protein n=1 Tax=Nakamurella alba TaxID=2665158 RepID=A0A7K1FJB6_9ACTN|nr:GntR family transcriptional regulator [Nakamurella alba]MTD14156.1 FCD domain-containing protein [Nakamurella alba]